MADTFISWTPAKELQIEVPENIANIFNNYKVNTIALPLQNVVIPWGQYKIEIKSNGKTIKTFVGTAQTAYYSEIFNIAQTTFDIYEVGEELVNKAFEMINWTISTTKEANGGIIIDKSPLTTFTLFTELKTDI